MQEKTFPKMDETVYDEYCEAVHRSVCLIMERCPIQ